MSQTDERVCDDDDKLLESSERYSNLSEVHTSTSVAVGRFRWVRRRNWCRPSRTSSDTVADGNAIEGAQSSSTVWHPSRHVVGNASGSSRGDS